MKLKRASEKLTLLSGCLCLSALLAAAGCGSKTKESEPFDEPPSGLDWSNGSTSFLAEWEPVEPYTGDDPATLEAQDRLATGADLHAKVILRSCGPLSGVCHNKKEYPDLHTTYNFLSAIGAPCNVQPGSYEGVFDRCERPGDRVAFEGGPEVEIGWIEFVSGEEEETDDPKLMPGLHIHLADAVSGDRNREMTVRFIRTFVDNGEVQDISFASLRTRFTFLDGGKHVVARARYNLEKQVRDLLQVGIEQGDLNRNGIFGARPDKDGNVRGPISLIVPGDPESSYLVGRLRGKMHDEVVPGTRMPLANPPFSTAEMLALFCFIEGLPPSGGVNLDAPIDYASCSYNRAENQEALAIEGVGKGWLERISPMLESNCGGCHSKELASSGLVLVGPGSYDAIVNKASEQDLMGRPLIAPGDPEGSYLLLKLKGDPSIQGLQMPVDPLLGVRTLGEAELQDLEEWIAMGAPPS
jgi:hypothetical protein